MNEQSLQQAAVELADIERSITALIPKAASLQNSIHRAARLNNVADGPLCEALGRGTVMYGALNAALCECIEIHALALEELDVDLIDVARSGGSKLEP